MARIAPPPHLAKILNDLGAKSVECVVTPLTFADRSKHKLFRLKASVSTAKGEELRINLFQRTETSAAGVSKRIVMEFHLGKEDRGIAVCRFCRNDLQIPPEPPHAHFGKGSKNNHIDEDDVEFTLPGLPAGLKVTDLSDAQFLEIVKGYVKSGELGARKK